jgi:hypothetical protein
VHIAIEEFFDNAVKAMRQSLSELDERVPEQQAPSRDSNFEKLTRILQTVEQSCAELESKIGNDAELLKQTRDRFQKALSPWFDRSWVGERARTKPRGYPGDYKLLTVLYNQTPVSTGLPGYIDIYISDLLLAKSIRSRWQKVREFLMDELQRRPGQDVSILNVASGACREYSEPLEEPSGRSVKLQCLDNDQEALDFVRDNVVHESGLDEFRLDRFNALRLMSSKSAIRKFGRFDIVYSIGLFDYIPDEPLIAILRTLREMLNDGGVAYINFKDRDRYDKTPYQWLLDWHFFQRTVADCERLFEAAGYDVTNMRQSRDDTGVVVNFVTRRSGPSIRIDGAEVMGLPHQPDLAAQTMDENVR